MVATLWACEKEENTENIEPPAGIYLKAVHSNNGSSVTSYNYNASGELINTEQSFMNQVSGTHLFATIGNEKSITYFNPSMEIEGAWNIKYVNNRVTDIVHYINFVSIGGEIWDINEHYDYNINGEIRKIESNDFFSSRREFEYGINGNLTSIKLFDRDGNPTESYYLQYDDKKNPYYLLDPTVISTFYYYSLSIVHFYFLSPNNVTRCIRTLGTGDTVSVNLLTYQYNQHGYPVSKFEMEDSVARENGMRHYEYNIID